jgi:hypothetical protein
LVSRFNEDRSYAPVANSIRGITRGGAGQIPLLPFSASFKNIVWTYWQGSNIRDQTISLQYVKDSRETNLVKQLQVRGNQIFADNLLVWEAPSTNNVSK